MFVAPLLWIAQSSMSFAPQAAEPAEDYEWVSVEQLMEDPAHWDGRRVRVEGLVVREFENFGLYRDYDAYCDVANSAEGPVAIYADWPDGFAPVRHFRREAVVEGVFRHRVGQSRVEGGHQFILISTAAPGPGPLEEIRRVRWTSAMLPACRRRQFLLPWY